jgi:hypothetical protein
MPGRQSGRTEMTLPVLVPTSHARPKRRPEDEQRSRYHPHRQLKARHACASRRKIRSSAPSLGCGNRREAGKLPTAPQARGISNGGAIQQGGYYIALRAGNTRASRPGGRRTTSLAGCSRVIRARVVILPTATAYLRPSVRSGIFVRRSTTRNCHQNRLLLQCISLRRFSYACAFS